MNIVNSRPMNLTLPSFKHSLAKRNRNQTVPQYDKCFIKNWIHIIIVGDSLE